MKIRKAVIPAAGYGTRFLPATKVVPKELFPIGNKPAIQYIVEEAVQAGVQEIVFITSEGKKLIEDYFKPSPPLEAFLKEKDKLDLLPRIEALPSLAQFHFVNQPVPKGLGDAVLCAKEIIGNEPFLVLLPDDVIWSRRSCCQQLSDTYQEGREAVIALENVLKDRVSLYGIVKTKPAGKGVHLIQSVIEKPALEEAPSTLAIIGRYLLPPTIFPILEKTRPGQLGEIQLADALHKLAGRGETFGLEFQGKRFDVGEPQGLVEANLALSPF
ncbi:MAG: UTP--glucose-1-phosphate uridylyltransferase [Deltaproteobacteria bacterium]|nr:UTP--glucose-1-phosphate uridylyltransferase [Deltaproteobacteria bacterium]